jgi:AcrR family transcriptional regulator
MAAASIHSMPVSPELRALTRRGVLAEISSSAEELFREQGYDATTVDHIAARVGMSQRTFFRYVGSKEDLVLATHFGLADEMFDIVASRPSGEDAWTSLRHAFEVFVAQHADDEARSRAQQMISTVESSASLRATFLERNEVVQRRLTDALHARYGGTLGRSVVRGVVGAAFAALGAATEHCDLFGSSGDFEAELDHVMGALRPRALTDRASLAASGERDR